MVVCYRRDNAGAVIQMPTDKEGVPAEEEKKCYWFPPYEWSL
jgi:hypothetical protein